ncbi:MAG: oligosaccharide flippase family protein [Bacteroidales bacterium]|nr:oligosaccharide flippase family protein [Bacteroidales bacterium]
MSDAFKSLAGQTAVYGLGTMVPRLLNYLLVPLYTRVFAAEVYGQSTELYAYVALLMALLTYGMETTFFRYGKGERFGKVYGNIMTSILATTGLFVALAVAAPSLVAGWMGYEGKQAYILLLGLVVALDAICAVPFCVLRQQNQAKRFSLIKITNVGVNVGLNLLFLLAMPQTSQRIADAVFGPAAGQLTWVFVSNLIASLVAMAMLWPQMRQIKLQCDKELMRSLLSYSLPIMFINLIGMVNEVADKLVIKWMMPQEVALTQLGIYGANYKLAVLMTIFVQMFRFASEPFFFSKANDRNSPRLFADVMTYFVICGLAIFLLITLFLPLFALFIGPEYREGLGIVPIVIFANLMYGVVFNLGIWYKLSDHTHYGTIITAVGAVVTVLCLVALVPAIGYWGAACAHFGCYFVMMVISYVWGQKVYPIPYNVRRIAFYVLLAVVLFALGYFPPIASKPLKYGLCAAYLLLFLAVAYKRDLRKALKE